MELVKCFVACSFVSNLKYGGNKEDLMELLILVNRKSANISAFPLIIFVYISEIWQAFLVFKSRIFNFFCLVTSVKKIILAFMFSLNSKNTWVVFVFHHGF